jgi:hypothetical protein
MDLLETRAGNAAYGASGISHSLAYPQTEMSGLETFNHFAIPTLRPSLLESS